MLHDLEKEKVEVWSDTREAEERLLRKLIAADVSQWFARSPQNQREEV